MPHPAEEIANRIELHLKLDTVGTGYALSEQEQQIIIDCLRFTAQYEDCAPEAWKKGYQAGLDAARPDQQAEK